MRLLSSINLEIQYQQRLEHTQEIEKEVENLEAQLKEAKRKHAVAMKDLCELKIYKQLAKRDNEHNYFEWLESESKRYDNSGKEYQNFFWDYETPTMRFKIKIKERHDLKVWKYEVHVSGNKVYFESYEHIKMYDRNRREGWSMGWTNFLVDHYPNEKLVQKFKTYEEAILCVDEWRKDLKKNFSYEINYDKSLYRQAISKYQFDSIHIQLNYECANTFYEEIKQYQVELSKGDYWNVEITGEQAKEIVFYIKDKHNMNFEILAG